MRPGVAGNMSTMSLMSCCIKWAESFSWLKEVEICGEHVCGTSVHSLCTSYTFNSALSRGNIARLLRSGSELVDSTQHRKGSQWSHSIQCFKGCAQCQSRKDAAAKEAAAAAQAAPLSYASRPLHVAKIAHAINKQEGPAVLPMQSTRCPFCRALLLIAWAIFCDH